MQRSLTLLAIFSFAALPLGCGDDVAPHGVSPGRGADTLDQEEIDAVCVDGYNRPAEALLPTVREYCTVDALVRTILGGGSESVCGQYLEDCLADPPTDLPTEIDPIDPVICPSVSDLAGCELTVGDFDACTAARVEAIEDAWGQVSCASLSSAAAIDEIDLDALPECVYLSDTCPTVF